MFFKFMNECVLITGRDSRRDSAVRINPKLLNDHQHSEDTKMCSYVCVCVCVCVFQDISSVYQIFTDEVLGSGQFGVVYKGNLLLNFLGDLQPRAGGDRKYETI